MLAVREEANLAGNPDTDLQQQLEALIAQQMADWPLLRDNHRSRALGRKKTVALGPFPIDVHCNPGRIHSTTAKADAASIQQRTCKLCPQQWFAGQRGLACGYRLMILCNPFPVLERHLTIVDRVHVPQALEGRVESLLSLAKDLSDEFVVFYNGPHCGASTPEHFHLQAVPRAGVPLLTHMAMIQQVPALKVHKRQIAVDQRVELFVLNDYYARLLIFRGSDGAALQRCLLQMLQQFAALLGTRQEPPVNLLVTFDHPNWSIYCFPRAKHRPQCYFDGTFTVSPASLDIAGCLVVPVPEQFDQATGEQVLQVFSETTVGQELFEQLLRTLA